MHSMGNLSPLTERTKKDTLQSMKRIKTELDTLAKSVKGWVEVGGEDEFDNERASVYSQPGVFFIFPIKEYKKLKPKFEAIVKKDNNFHIKDIGWLTKSDIQNIKNSSLYEEGDKLYGTSYEYKEGEDYTKELQVGKTAPGGFANSGFAWIGIRASYPSKGYKIGKGTKFEFLFHITLLSNLKKVIRQGLQPKTREDRTYPPRVYLLTQEEAAKDFAKILHGGAPTVIFAISSKKLVKLRPDILLWKDPEPGAHGSTPYAYFTDVDIPPQAFTRVYGKDPKTKKLVKFNIENGKLIKKK